MTTRKTAIYIRKSREGEAGSEDALHNQRENLTRLALEKGYTDFDLYEEIESSIKWNRPELTRLVSGIEAGHYSRILVAHIDRLGRDIGLLDDIKKLCIENNVQIETPDSTIRFDDDNQELLYGFSSVLSDFEYKRIRHRLVKGKYDAVNVRGRWVSSIPALGYYYDREDKQLKPHPEESRIIRRMVETALQGHSYAKIADTLNNLGYRSRKGNKFASNTVQKLLTNRVYLGEVKYHSSVLKASAYAKDCHEPLMTEEEFQRIQKLIANRRSYDRMSRVGIKTALDGLLVCGVCGNNLYLQRQSKTRKERQADLWAIKKCRNFKDGNHLNTIGCRAELIEEAVLTELKSHRNTLQRQVELLLTEDTSGIEAKLHQKKADLQSDLKKQSEKLPKLLDLYLDNSLPKETYHKRREAIEATVKTLQYEIERTEKRLAQMDVTAYADRIEQVIDTLDNFEQLPLEEQNSVLRLIVDRIAYLRDDSTELNPEITIYWKSV